ncbi:hypothetical protein CA2015_0416 [Cyclobacterium amurskyense]|uniref:Uncharacterized protein n=1 Tax=Cyclobacterium amurskyense TaxID=320787 RepID=A0A0H4P6U8_9BACT|nr:hypothetical protein CA2015_0416 [Cyclobacterium amurskyense]
MIILYDYYFPIRQLNSFNGHQTRSNTLDFELRQAPMLLYTTYFYNNFFHISKLLSLINKFKILFDANLDRHSKGLL